MLPLLFSCRFAPPELKQSLAAAPPAELLLIIIFLAEDDTCLSSHRYQETHAIDLVNQMCMSFSCVNRQTDSVTWIRENKEICRANAEHNVGKIIEIVQEGDMAEDAEDHC